MNTLLGIVIAVGLAMLIAEQAFVVVARSIRDFRKLTDVVRKAGSRKPDHHSTSAQPRAAAEPGRPAHSEPKSVRALRPMPHLKLKPVVHLKHCA